MAKRWVVAGLTSAALAACGSHTLHNAPARSAFFVKEQAYAKDLDSRALLIGQWLGQSDDPDGTHRLELKRLRADGSYEMTFVGTRSGATVMNQTEVGLWGVSGDIFFTIFRGYLRGKAVLPVTGEDPTNYDAYRISLLSSMRLEYTDVVEGRKFVETRVADDYVLPLNL